MTQEIHGTVADGFEAVREEFTAFVAGERADYEGQLCAYVHGRKVVDLWAGTGADATPPTDAGPFARISGMFGREPRSVGSAALRLNAIEASECGPVGVASRTACCSGVGAIGWVVRKRGSSGAGSPRWKSSPYGVLIRSW